jgi:hypothetical protein
VWSLYLSIEKRPRTVGGAVWINGRGSFPDKINSFLLCDLRLMVARMFHNRFALNGVSMQPTGQKDHRRGELICFVPPMIPAHP